MQDFNLCKTRTMRATKMVHHAFIKLTKYRFTVRVMKITAVMLVIGFLHVSAKTPAQEKITLREKGVALTKIFTEINKQTGYDFFFTTQALQNAKPVDIDVKNASLKEVLDICFKDQNLTYVISDNLISIRTKKKSLTEQIFNLIPRLQIHGKVVNEQGEPVVASVTIKGTMKGTTTNERGEFLLVEVDPNSVLLITGVNIEPKEINVDGKFELYITVKYTMKELDATLIKGYYVTTKRLNTGNVSKVTAEEIGKQPVSNFIASLEGRVPGLSIQQESGLTGANFVVQIRGQNSIAQGNFPLYIVDGVPFSAANVGAFGSLNQLLKYGVSNQSPLNSINPSDIESVEVLKDADATAIYGSRGANGIIIITTKKGMAGKTSFTLNASSGIGKVTRIVSMLNTQQYLLMRHEAFQNDALSPDPNYDFDLTSWDTTRYTNWQELLIGGTAPIHDVQASVTGGNVQTQFSLGTDYRYEGNVFPGDLSNSRITAHLSLTHSSLNKKFSLTSSTIFSYDKNTLPLTDLTSFIDLPPNAPAVYDSAGHLNWENGTFNNPLSYLLRKYEAQTDNLSSSMVISYEVVPGLQVKGNLGYTNIEMQQIATYPKKSFDPSTSPISSSIFGNNSVKTWIIEPQLIYSRKIKSGNISSLIGATFQNDVVNGNSVTAQNFPSDALLETMSSASLITVNSTNYSQYRYNAVFFRFNYDYNGKYILNVTGRRDGSSRFGENNQFANFGAFGLAWLFSKEKFITSALPFLDYGKLRCSYGLTGNDQIGNYQYLSAYGGTRYPYQSIPGLYPLRLNNPNFSWEINRKFEGAIELGLLKNRVLLNVVYYRNRSSSQLVGYPLPGQTGFTSVQANLNALVQNEGWEFEVTAKPIQKENLKWDCSVNLSIPRNKLLEFPQLANSSYAYQYVIGQPLNIVQAFHFTGVDPQTGIYTFEDIDKDGNISYPQDLAINKKLGQSFFGGLLNTFIYKGWQLDFLFQFVKQTGRNYIYYNYNSPGMMNNFPDEVLKRWSKPGDIKPVQQFTQDYGSAAFNSWNNANTFGDNNISDASFIRLKNVSLAYVFPLKKHKSVLQSIKIFAQGQNLITLTKFLGSDPETQGYYTLPPLKVMTFGLQFTF